MSVSTDSSTPVDYLLGELARLRGENRRLRRRVEWLRVSRDDWKRRARTRHQPRLLPGDPRHGTENGYGNLGCRCDKCRAAHSAYCLDYQHRTGRHRPYAEWLASVEGCHVPHGTESRYTNGGCRCEECRRASAEARKRRRAALSPEDKERLRAYDRNRRRSPVRDPLVSKARQPLSEQDEWRRRDETRLR